MKFIYKPAPNYRDKKSTQSIMMDVTIALLMVAIFAIGYYYVQYGLAYSIRIVSLILVAVTSSVITEVIWSLVMKKKVTEFLSTSFPWVTGLILALMCQVSTSYFALIIGSIFAILFGKLLFGGFGHNIFNPAAVGRAIMMSSFASAVAVDFVTSATPTTTMNSYGWLITDSALGTTFLSNFGGLSGLFFVTYAGAIGETSTLAILIAGVYLVFRKAIDWRIPIIYLGSIFAMASLVMVSKQTVIWYPLFHLLTGGVMFGAVFMLTDPVTSPTSMSGRIIFAIGCAIITMVIRLKANLPEGVLFSILLMNMLTPMIESLTDGQQINHRNSNIRSIAVISVVGLALIFVISTLINPIDPNAVVTPVEPEAKQISMTDTKLDAYQGEIISSEVNGDETTYLVSMPGYGVLYSTDDYYTYTNNEFSIVVNTIEKKLVSVAYVTFGDTPKIGDKTNDEEYLKTFIDIDLTDTQQDVDLVSGATYSSMSVVAAIRLVMNELGN